MWLLLIVLIHPVPGVDRRTVLNQFADDAVGMYVCKAEEYRVGHEMAVAYPDDHSYVIECKSMRDMKMDFTQPEKEL